MGINRLLELRKLLVTGSGFDRHLANNFVETWSLALVHSQETPQVNVPVKFHGDFRDLQAQSSSVSFVSDFLARACSKKNKNKNKKKRQ